MRLAFFAGGSIRDRKAWSGTVYYAHRALAKRFEVIPLEMPNAALVLRGLRKIVRPTGLDPLREPLCALVMSRIAGQMVALSKSDAVFVLGASHIAAGLADRFPVFHCSDATFAMMLDYHGEFSGLSRRTISAGNRLEQRVISGSRAVFVASDCAAQSVRADYKRTAGVHVVPFGANLDELPASDTWQRGDVCSLVFIGVTWYAKGADVAVDAARILNERGIRTQLHIVGCAPPAEAAGLPYVTYHGFLRKQIPAEYSALTALVAQADFLVLPTRFEAFGIVFCEAAAYGTPAVARATGGIPTIVEDGLTGALLPPDAGAEAYADRIQEIWTNPARYENMRRLALAKSRSILNWDAWGNRVQSVIQETLSQDTTTASRRPAGLREPSR